jgi:hypothetical protein
MRFVSRLSKDSQGPTVMLYEIVAAGRILLGAGLMMHPGVFGGLWLGRATAKQPVTRYHSRINGGREAALGASLLSTVGNAQGMKRLLWVGALFDIWDACVAFFVGGSLGKHRRAQAVIAPAIWVALSIMASRQIKHDHFH